MEDHEYFFNKRTDKTYISRTIKSESLNPDIPDRNIRIISKVIDTKETHHFAQIKDEVVIRITPSEREELIAKIYEDTRGIFTLTFQKFTKKTGNPHSTSFSFVGDEILTLIKFLSNIKNLPISSGNKQQITDIELKDLLLTREQTSKLIIENQDLFLDLFKSDITKADIIALGYRKKQLDIFNKLLTDGDFFIAHKSKNGIDKDESVWQDFFERNTWIFGYGINYIFTSSLDGKKLEQVVKGYDFKSSGKRTDALLKTRGLISALCFVEIKKHNTPLLNNSKEYRADCWRVSDELSGSVSQIQKSVQKAIKSIQTKTEIIDKAGNPTGEILFLYNPKSYVVIGSLEEFKTEIGVNEEKYSSFEIFRNNLNQPEIITFDELYERAKFIVKASE